MHQIYYNRRDNLRACKNILSYRYYAKKFVTEACRYVVIICYTGLYVYSNNATEACRHVGTLRPTGPPIRSQYQVSPSRLQPSLTRAICIFLATTGAQPAAWWWLPVRTSGLTTWSQRWAKTFCTVAQSLISSIRADKLLIHQKLLILCFKSCGCIGVLPYRALWWYAYYKTKYCTGHCRKISIHLHLNNSTVSHVGTYIHTFTIHLSHH